MRSRNSGFSMVELIVVAAIIALMVGVLLPVLAKAKGAAGFMGCASNLRQIGIATAAYQQDNDSYYPYALYGPTADFYSDDATETWDDFLGRGGYDGRYLTDAEAKADYILPKDGSGLYKCPLDNYDRQYLTGKLETINVAPRSYKINHYRKNGSYLDYTGRGVSGIELKNGVLQYTSIRVDYSPQPSNTIVLAEHATFYPPTNRSGNALGNSFSPYAYFISYDDRYWGSDLSSAIGHKNPKGSSAAPSSSEMKANWLFADGHVENLDALTTFTLSNGNVTPYFRSEGTMWDALRSGDTPRQQTTPSSSPD